MNVLTVDVLDRSDSVNASIVVFHIPGYYVADFLSCEKYLPSEWQLNQNSCQYTTQIISTQQVWQRMPSEYHGGISWGLLGCTFLLFVITPKLLRKTKQTSWWWRNGPQFEISIVSCRSRRLGFFFSERVSRTIVYWSVWEIPREQNSLH